jgi:hypothetical protein
LLPAGISVADGGDVVGVGNVDGLVGAVVVGDVCFTDGLALPSPMHAVRVSVAEGFGS